MLALWQIHFMTSILVTNSQCVKHRTVHVCRHTFRNFTGGP